MRWRKLSEHAIESDAGYCVLRCTADGIPTGRYIAFVGRTTKETTALPLGGYNSSEEAREICEAHLSTVTRKTA